MKKKILTIFISIIVVLSCVLGLTACNNNNSSGGNGQTPVYQGMTISSDQSAFNLARPMSAKLMLATMFNDIVEDENQDSQLEGDYEGRDEAVDQENPFPDNDSDETIEEEIKSTLEVVGSGQDIYYANANENIYINIHISNPDNYEIMSFTLNGKKYSSYMFEEGSDMETLILKYNVGDSSGIQEYTIDAIKYIDGTDIKDVIMDGDKTVLAGVRVENQVSASIKNLDIQTNALSFDVKIKDNDELVSYSQGCLKAVIYDGESVVGTKDLVVGDNNVVFDNLETSTLYQYAIVGYYDDLSGIGFAMNTLYKQAFYTKAVVLFDNIVISQEGIQFGFVWDSEFQNKTLSSLTLCQGKTKTDILTTATNINNLRSNTVYSLVAEYVNGNKTESIYLEFKTQAKAIPEIEIANPTATQTSVGFAINETDVDSVGAISKIELIHANGTVVAESVDVREFVELLSNNTYTVKVTYTYDLNDGVGTQEIVKTLDVKTQAKAVPYFTVKNETITTNNINAKYNIVDVDNVLSIYKVELYKGNSLVKESADKEINFANLDYYNDYIVKFIYSYNLNDGVGVQTGCYDYTFKTLPYIDVTECNIANTSAVSEGETIYMSVKLDNPLSMAIESVVINDITYSVTGASTKNKIFVEIVYNGQFAGGDTYLKIDKVNAKIDGEQYVAEPKTELADNVFINGKLEVVKIEYVNESFEPIDWAFPSDIICVLVTLSNPTGYIIDSIAIEHGRWNELEDITELNKIDNNHFYFTISLEEGWNEEYLKDIKYHNDYIENVLTYSYSMTTDRLFVVVSDEIKYISTIDDLKNMNGGHYYELTKDIDLSGIEWQDSKFCGVFEGNGYSIKNMSFVGTIKNAEARLGLFSSGSGVIQNLNIEEATIIAELTSNDENFYAAYVGGLVAEGNYLNIYNCSVDEYSIFSIKNVAGGNAIGGLIGNAAATITNSINRADISLESTNFGFATSSIVGGLVGCLSGGKCSIYNSTNNGNINVSSENGYIGGLAGLMNGSIYNSINKGYANITGHGYIGGLAGFFNGYVEEGINYHSINAGTITEKGNIIHGLFGSFNTIHYGENSFDLSVFENVHYDGEVHTYVFESDGGDIIDAIITNSAITLSAPTKAGYVFVGWYDNPEFNGTAYTTIYYSSTKTTLYAKWISETEWYNGSSFEKAKTITYGASTSVIYDKAEETIYYKFVPTESKSYTIKSSGDLNIYGYIYDSTTSYVAYNYGFSITHSLTAGETYYIVVYNNWETGTFTVSIA